MKRRQYRKSFLCVELRHVCEGETPMLWRDDGYNVYRNPRVYNNTRYNICMQTFSLTLVVEFAGLQEEKLTTSRWACLQERSNPLQQ